MKREVEDQMNDIERKRLEKVKALAGAGKVRFADSSKVEQYHEQVTCVLDAIAIVRDNPRIRHAWVSDGSTLYDFDVEPDDWVRIAVRLGVYVWKNDYLWQVAERLASK